MKNFVQEGDVITLAAPYTVVSGDGLLVGSIFGVATASAASGDAVETAVTGVFDLAKTASQAWTVGARIYWDDATKLCTTVAAAGANKLIGVALVAVGSGAGETIGRVRLSANFTI